MVFGNQHDLFTPDRTGRNANKKKFRFDKKILITVKEE
jgi:hypothetical protein